MEQRNPFDFMGWFTVISVLSLLAFMVWIFAIKLWPPIFGW